MKYDSCCGYCYTFFHKAGRLATSFTQRMQTQNLGADKTSREKKQE